MARSEGLGVAVRRVPGDTNPHSVAVCADSVVHLLDSEVSVAQGVRAISPEPIERNGVADCRHSEKVGLDLGAPPVFAGKEEHGGDATGTVGFGTHRYVTSGNTLFEIV
jgi:hypothetical protein